MAGEVKSEPEKKSLGGRFLGVSIEAVMAICRHRSSSFPLERMMRSRDGPDPKTPEMKPTLQPFLLPEEEEE
jgi:hypothetical protein